MASAQPRIESIVGTSTIRRTTAAAMPSTSNANGRVERRRASVADTRQRLPPFAPSARAALPNRRETDVVKHHDAGNGQENPDPMRIPGVGEDTRPRRLPEPN